MCSETLSFIFMAICIILLSFFLGFRVIIRTQNFKLYHLHASFDKSFGPAEEEQISAAVSSLRVVIASPPPTIQYSSAIFPLLLSLLDWGNALSIGVLL